MNEIFPIEKEKADFESENQSEFISTTAAYEKTDDEHYTTYQVSSTSVFITTESSIEILRRIENKNASGLNFNDDDDELKTNVTTFEVSLP